MPILAVVVPGDFHSRTGGYAYDRRIVEGLQSRGWSVGVHTLDGSFPFPTDAARAHAVRTLADLPRDTLTLIDGLAFGALADEAAHERSRLRLVALVHHPLALETGIDAGAAAAIAISERRALRSARLVIVTSHATAHVLGDYGVTRDRIAVVEPGTDAAPLARGLGSPLQLLSVASVTPRKGHDTLVQALSTLSNRPWHLTCAGSLDRDPATVARLRARIAAGGLAGRVTLTGELDQDAVAREYERADVFVLPTHHEGYGMAIAEALAHGLPVISTATGAIPELIDGGAGLLVPPGDLAALAAALSRLMDDAGFLAELSAGARSVRDRLPTWDTQIEKMDTALSQVPPGDGLG